MAIYCIHCGTELPDIAQFCSKCGKPPKGEETVNAAPTVSTPLPETYPAYKSDGPSDIDSHIPPPPPLSSYYASESLYAPSSASAPSAPPIVQRKRRRVLWISLVVIAVVLVAIGGVAYYFVNQSTPTKTLQTFCDDEKNQNYQGVYNLLSEDLQRQLGTEGKWAANAQQADSSMGGVTSCVFFDVNENGAAASGKVTTTYGDGTISASTFLLVDENGAWKINGVATP